MMLSQGDLINIDGVPAHPLVVHAVVVLLPLAALGGLVMAARASWRRRFDVVVLLLTIAGVAAVPLATKTGEQLENVLPANPAIDRHQELGDTLLPFAIAFGVAMLLLVVAGRLADQERDRARIGGRAGDTARRGVAGDGPADDMPGTATAGDTAPTTTATDVRVARTWRRLAIVAAALVAFTGVAMTVQIVRIGHTGAAAVWQGVGGG